ncbi:hypothetical protein O181_067238 [Austropuccinia psidii MF-1]|uniref:DUF4939 domain-containing protein n=1 Tax=Austropuccinia psidii MF-1 TaxID=1389203 RepID=A0A9Q3ESZ2_9BASI|nr:hypothetical protein [Austropuccinia psidii MF-1]
MSQRNQDVIIPTAKAPLDCTPSVHQLIKNLDRGSPVEGAVPSRRGGVKSRRSRSFSGLLGGYPSIFQGPRSRLGEAEDEEGEESMKEEEYEENKLEASLAGVPEASEAPNTALSNKTLVSKAKPNLLKMMEKMTKFMGQLTQAVAPRKNSRSPEFKAPSMKAPDFFDGTQAHKLKVFIQYCQLIFRNYPEYFFSYRKKVLYSAPFLTGSAGKWISPYLSNISDEDPSYLLNNWHLFEPSYSLCLVIPMNL